AWRLGCAIATPRRALLATLALDGLIFFTYDTAEFSNNVVLNTTWALTVLCFFHAARTRQWRWWLLTGIVIGLGLLCKYTLAVLVLPLVLLLLWRRDPLPPTPLPIVGERGRGEGRVLSGVALMSAAAFVVFVPHLVWMVRHDFITITYGLDRSASEKTWWTHL